MILIDVVEVLLTEVVEVLLTEVVEVPLTWSSGSGGPLPKACRLSINRLVKSAVLGFVLLSRSMYRETVKLASSKSSWAVLGFRFPGMPGKYPVVSYHLKEGISLYFMIHSPISGLTK